GDALLRLAREAARGWPRGEPTNMLVWSAPHRQAPQLRVARSAADRRLAAAAVRSGHRRALRNALSRRGTRVGQLDNGSTGSPSGLTSYRSIEIAAAGSVAARP